MVEDNANIAFKHDVVLEANQEQVHNKQWQVDALPEGFVYIDQIISNIQVDLKYYTADNFTGAPVPGYEANRAIGTIEAAEALKKVQNELNTLGLGVKIFDFYRPSTAVHYFKKWCLNGKDDPKLKEQYYPTINKPDLLKGYIAEYSTHSRGSTVDLTLINLETGEEFDMGTQFDFLGEPSHTQSDLVSDAAQENRQLLVNVMQKHGFSNYVKEWWHFSLNNEPFPLKPQHHFDFMVK